MARRTRKSRPVINVLLVLVALIIGLSLGKNWLVGRAIEHQASAALGVKVTVNSVNLQLLSGAFAIGGLNIANPPGFTSPHLLHMGSIEGKVQLSSLTQNLLQIDTIRLDHISLYYEIGAGGNNLAVLQKSLKKNATLPAAEEKTAARHWQIALLQIQNVSVVPNVKIGGESIGQRIALADMELRDIGSDKAGIGNAELANIILGTIAKNSGQKLPANMVEQGLGNIGKGLRDVGKGILGN